MVDDAQVEELRLRLDGLEERSQTLLNLNIRGAISLGARDALDALLADYDQRVVYLRSDVSGLQTQATDADLINLRSEGFQAAALDRLRESVDEPSKEAIRLMYRLQREASNAPS
jgi:hypothetical protein